MFAHTIFLLFMHTIWEISRRPRDREKMSRRGRNCNLLTQALGSWAERSAAGKGGELRRTELETEPLHSREVSPSDFAQGYVLGIARGGARERPWTRGGGTYPVQSSLWCNHRAIQLKKVSKNSEKNLECASQPTSYIYKISGSNSSSSRSYKKHKFRLHLNYYFCQKICLFCNF